MYVCVDAVFVMEAEKKGNLYRDGVVQSKSVRRRGAEQERGNDWQ